MLTLRLIDLIEKNMMESRGLNIYYLNNAH